MLTIRTKDAEFFDQRDNTFKTVNGKILKLEHSLISLSKWESKWKKPFLKKDYKPTLQEYFDYIMCMSIDSTITIADVMSLSEKDREEISNYISDPMTATWFSKSKAKGSSSEILTSELIYYYMFEAGIPIDCEKWHLNRLLTLLRICAEKSKSSGKTMSKKDILSNNAALNAARRKIRHTKG